MLMLIGEKIPRLLDVLVWVSECTLLMYTAAKFVRFGYDNVACNADDLWALWGCFYLRLEQRM